MKLRALKDWHKNAEFEGLLFFAQKCDELFFDYTLDSYKPPALTSIYLCQEALALISDVEEGLIDEQNLKHILDELTWSLSLDLVAKKMLNAPAENFIIHGDKIKISETKIRLEVLGRTLHPLRYIDKCYSDLKEAIKQKSKIKIDRLSYLLASSLINHGISKQHIYEQAQEFFFSGDEITSLDDIDKFFKLTSPTQHNYEVYFVASKLIEEVGDSISAFEVSIIESPPEEAHEVASSCGLIPNDDEVWVEVEGIEECDRHSARKMAEANLDNIRDLFLLFSHKNRICWREQTIITQCCDETPVVIGKPKNSMEKCFDLRPNDASIRLNSLIKNVALKKSSFVKFSRAVDLHGIGSTNDLPENQLLNIWIALETIVPSHINGSGVTGNVKLTH